MYRQRDRPLARSWSSAGGEVDRRRRRPRLAPLHRLFLRKYYFDEAYLWLVRTVQQGIAVASDFVEQNVLIRGIVDGVAAAARWSGAALRELQTGSIHTYVRFALAGSVIAAGWTILAFASRRP